MLHIDIVFSVLLYGSEMYRRFTVSDQDMQIPEQADMSCALLTSYTLLGIYWTDHVTNAEVSFSTDLSDIISIIAQRRHDALFRRVHQLNPYISS